jgi:hypothetical protein
VPAQRTRMVGSRVPRHRHRRQARHRAEVLHRPHP